MFLGETKERKRKHTWGREEQILGVTAQRRRRTVPHHLGTTALLPLHRHNSTAILPPSMLPTPAEPEREKRNRTERGKEKTGGETEGEDRRGEKREGKKTVAAYNTTPAASTAASVATAPGNCASLFPVVNLACICMQNVNKSRSAANAELAGYCACTVTSLFGGLEHQLSPRGWPCSPVHFIIFLF
jgi:hypothetical protein